MLFRSAARPAWNRDRASTEDHTEVGTQDPGDFVDGCACDLLAEMPATGAFDVDSYLSKNVAVACDILRASSSTETTRASLTPSLCEGRDMRSIRPATSWVRAWHMLYTRRDVEPAGAISDVVCVRDSLTLDCDSECVANA